MDINATDIAALQKILQQAEEWMLQKGEDPNAAAPSEAPPPEEPPPEAEPAVEVEIEAAPAPKPEREVLDTFDFAGRMSPNESEPPRREPVSRPARKGRY